jgi:hypothetical protein
MAKWSSLQRTSLNRNAVHLRIQVAQDVFV